MYAYDARVLCIMHTHLSWLYLRSSVIQLIKRNRENSLSLVILLTCLIKTHLLRNRHSAFSRVFFRVNTNITTIVRTTQRCKPVELDSRQCILPDTLTILCTRLWLKRCCVRRVKSLQMRYIPLHLRDSKLTILEFRWLPKTHLFC